MRILRAIFPALLALLLTATSQADWFAPTPPKPGDTALQTVGMAPKDSLVVFSWNLKGQLDLVDFYQRGLKVLAIEEDNLARYVGEFEEELKRSVPEILGYFSGTGFLAVLNEDFRSRSEPPIIFVLGLEKPEEFHGWFQSFAPSHVKREKGANGFHLLLDGDLTIGYNRDFFFICPERDLGDKTLKLLSGEGPTLKSSEQYTRALKDLPYPDSALAFYADINAAQELAFQAAGFSGSDAPNPVWDYGIGAVDYNKQMGDAVLKLREGSSPMKDAVRAQARLSEDFLRKVPDLSAYVAIDGAWYASSLMSVSEEIPMFGMFAAMVVPHLNRFGQVSEGFDGKMAVGSNIFDQLYPRSKPPFVIGLADVKDGALAEKIATGLFEAEAQDGTDFYQNNSGVKLRHDAQQNLLKFAWGDGSDDYFSNRINNGRSLSNFEREALQWSDGSLAIIQYFDLNTILNYWKSQNRDSGNHRVEVMGETLLQFFSDTPEGLFALKTSEAGLHYRIRGATSSPAIPVMFLGGFAAYGFLSEQNAEVRVEKH